MIGRAPSHAIALLVLAGALLGCAREVLPAFNSPEERACYLEARETLASNQRLIRAGTSFSLVTTEQGFVRTTERSAVFDRCMGGGETPPGALSDEGRIVLSQQELLIWDGLTDAQKRAALDFVQRGGTFADWVAATLPG